MLPSRGVVHLNDWTLQVHTNVSAKQIKWTLGDNGDNSLRWKEPASLLMAAILKAVWGNQSTDTWYTELNAFFYQ